VGNSHQYTLFSDRIYTLSAIDTDLLRCRFFKTPQQADIDSLMRNYDIDTAPYEMALQMAVLVRENPHLRFPEKLLPRLNGIFQYTHYQNTTQLHAFAQAAAALGEKGILPLMMKGVAFKYFFPSEPRIMNDTDFLVPRSRWQEAVETAEQIGFERKSFDLKHAADLRKGAASIDIHHTFLHFDFVNPDFTEQIFQHTQKVTAFGVEVLAPLPELFLVMTCSNAYTNFIHNAKRSDAIALYDILVILSHFKTLSWQKVADLANGFNIGYQVKIMLDLCTQVVPDVLPQKIKEELAKDLPMPQKSKIKFHILIKEKQLHKVRRREFIASPKSRTVKGRLRLLGINSSYLCLKLVSQNPLARKVMGGLLFEFCKRKRK